jgi:hypothetical protein
MRTLTIEIINEKALNLLKDMELLKLIRLRDEKTAPLTNWSRYKGAMKKQPLVEVDKQLNELRNAWE